MSLRIGIDVDGDLADFRTAFRAAATAALGRPVDDPGAPSASQSLANKDVKTVWEQIARTSNWWMTLKPYEPDQIARLYSLTRTAGWEVFFLTTRPPSGGDTVQFQTQSWIEQQGFYLPAVLTVPGSRGEVANALRLDVVIDDLIVNCVDVVSASTAKGLLMLRSGEAAAERHATDRGIGAVQTLEDALEVLERLHELLPSRRGRLLRLTEWFKPPQKEEPLPRNPRIARPLPPT
jgi:hypothetical protein